MLRPFLFFTLAVVCMAAVHAGDPPGKGPVEEEAGESQQQKRREALRASLRAPVNDADTTKRRLSPEQKAELRQQLRQQDPVPSNPHKEKNTP